MRKVSRSTSRVEQTIARRKNSASTGAALKVTARVLAEAARLWERRARFYERHRDYFPRLSSGRFVGRCHELEAAYRGLARVM